MAQIRYRANLSAKDFVFSSQNWGRSVIMKQYDQNFSRQIVSPTDPDKDIGIPQIFYCHNVMPAAQGFQSIGLDNVFAGPALAGGTVFQIIPWAANNTNLLGMLLVIDVGAGVYKIYSTQAVAAGTWSFLGSITGIPVASEGILPVTVASIGGVTYLWIPLTGCYSWDGGTWGPVALTGLTPSQIIGITESFGYMIAWSFNAVAWSSTISPTDFTPSLLTGAGGGQIAPLKGGITWIQHHTFGFIAFSETNCAAAVYSGNARYPFNFREIIGGGGMDSELLASLDSESGNLYGYTTAGLQIVSVTQAQVVFPELTNYIGGETFEDFNDATLLFSETQTSVIYKRVQVISNRYLVISYAYVNSVPQLYSHALVYDISMKRWGKIKFSHRQAFTLQVRGASQLARNSFCLLDPLGNIVQVDFSQYATTGGTILLGKYQHSRDRLITLQQVDLEYVPSTAGVTLHDMVTYDGKTFQSPQLLTAIANTSAPQYPTRLTGMNHSLILQGVWQLDSLMLTYSVNGRR